MQLTTMNKIIQQGEELLLSLLLTTMIVLSCLQIGMRLFFDSGFSWADPLLRYLVVWCGMLGALLAVSSNKHISIDLSHYLFPAKFKRVLILFSSIFSGVVCGILCYASFLFLKSEMEYGGAAFLSLPSWMWNGIFFPVFGFMALRFFIRGLLSFSPGSSSDTRGDRGENS